MTGSVASKISITRLDLNNPDHIDSWNAYVDGYGERGHHHSVNYVNLSMMNGLHENLSLMAFYDNEIVGVLPLVGMRHWLLGNKAISLPFLNYGGPLADTADVEEVLCDYALNLAAERKYTQVQLRSDSKLADSLTTTRGWQQFSHKACMLLPLPSDPNALGVGNASKRAKLRSQAFVANRKAESMGIAFEQLFGGAEYLDDFYAVISENMRDLGTPVWPKSFFEQVFALTDSEITIAYWDGKPVAAGWLFFHPGGRVSIPWASTLKKMNPMSVNTHLYFGILCRCIKHGKALFDFGRSTVDSGTYRFKAQWGAAPQQCYWYCRRVDGKLIKDGNGMAEKLVPIWKKLPLWVANRIGPYIMPYLPA